MDNFIEIYLHGSLATATGREYWKLKAESAAEALHAINAQTHDSLRRYFLKTQNAYGRFKVILNDKEIPFDKNLKQNNELYMKRDDIKRIDIVPVLEGAGWGWLGLALGIMILPFAQSPMAIMIAISLIAGGVSNLLSKPPAMPEQRQIQNPSSDPTQLANSYLFSGPVNVINEGGPVPLGYGRLIVGSQVIMSSYDIKYVNIADAGRVR